MPNNRNAKRTRKPFQIARAVKSSHGECYCLIEKGKNHIWISVSKLLLSPSEIFASMSDAGITLLTPSPQTSLKREIEEIEEFRPALVATQPGWVADNVYVHPNGEVQSPGRDTPEVIVTFSLDTAYSTSPNYS